MPAGIMRPLAFADTRGGARSVSPSPLILVMAAALLIALVNPIGYRGGGSDDWYYLEAARCWVAQGSPCLPTTHWAARLVVVAPVAAALGALGETRGGLAGVALLHGLAALWLFMRLVARQFGRLEAILAGLALAVTPIFAANMASLNIDMVELAWALAALFGLQQAALRNDRRWAMAAGVMLGVAIIARTTSLLLLPIGGLGVILTPSLRRFIAPAAAGLVAVLAFDALRHGVMTGDPLHGWRLALGHAQLPSTQIAAPIAPQDSPLFNRHLIAGWHRDMGLELHWSIDGLLNLLAHPFIGLTLLAAAALLLAERKAAPRSLWLLGGAGALDALGLIYALAIDPAPRMFLLLLCAAAAIIGVASAGLWRRGAGGKVAIGLALCLSAALSIRVVHDGYGLGKAAPILAAWANEKPRETAIDETTRRAFPFDPVLGLLPVAPISGRTRLVTLSDDACAPPGAGWRLVQGRVVPADDSPLVAALRARTILFGPRARASVCLFQGSNISSILRPNTLAMTKASGRLGS